MNAKNLSTSIIAFLLASVAIICLGSSAFAFPKSVGLFVSGNAGAGKNSGGVSAASYSAPSYWQEVYDQVTYSTLIGHTDGTWAVTGVYTPEDTKAISDAKANFGLLGVNSYSWAHDGVPSELGDRIYEYGASSSATASFYDSWKVDALGITPGTVGSLSLYVDLEGTRTDPWRNHYSNLSLDFTNYSHGSDSEQQAHAGEYVLTVPFTFGVQNNVTLGLTAETSAAYEGYNDIRQVITQGGYESVDFLNTARISNMSFFDATGNQITNFTLTAGSGHDYLANTVVTPEPVSSTLFLLGGGGMILIRRFKKFNV